MTKRNGGRAALTLTLPFIVIVGSALGVAGCTSQSAIEGPPCDEGAIQSALDASLGDSAESVFAIDDITCADGWAVAFPTVGAAEEEAITITAVFRAEGQSWVEVDRFNDEICGTYDPNEDVMNPAYPDDAQVPESLWRDACRTN
jgi:hypothetical protein